MRGLLRIKTPLHKGWQCCVEALFPPKCLLCRKEGAYLCKKHHRFAPPKPYTNPLPHVDGVIATTLHFDETAHKVTEYCKYHGFGALAEIMAKEMVQQVGRIKMKGVTLVPVPLHWTRHFWRGFNQAELLALAIQKQVPVQICRGLKRHRRTAQQAKLTGAERAQNVADAFVWKGRGKPPTTVYLVDDVVASGATLDAAAAALKAAGTKRVFGLTFAQGGK